jgi:hypothetical protein
MAILDWDSHNRRTRLATWIKTNDLNPKWWETDKIQEQDLDSWVKRQSASIVKRISQNHVEANLMSTLNLLDLAIQANDEKAMKELSKTALMHNTIRSGTSKEEITNLTLLISMVLCISDSSSAKR